METQPFQLKRLLAITLMFFSPSAYAQPFLINGTVEGNDTGTIVLMFINADGKRCVDTAVVHKGKFQFRGTVAGADFSYLNTDPFSIMGDNIYNRYERQLFIEPGIIQLKFQSGAIGNAEISGGNVQKQYDDFLNKLAQERKRLPPLLAKIDSLKTLLKDGLINAQTVEEKLSEISQVVYPIQAGIADMELSYIKQHPEKYLSIHFLQYAVGRIPESTIDSLYLPLSEKVKTSSLGNRFAQHYAKYKKAMGNDFPFDMIQLDEPAPPFTIYNSQDDTITLSTLNGKVVLLEFWELTCFPCLKSNHYHTPLCFNGRGYDSAGTGSDNSHYRYWNSSRQLRYGHSGIIAPIN